MTETAPLILTEDRGQVRLLTLNRPEKMNAYSTDLHHSMMDALDAADADPAVRAIVITGAGKAYCAGADISGGFSSVIDGQPSYEDEKHGTVSRDYGGMLNLRIYELNTPIIAAINGVAVGIGCTQLLPMDIRVASEKAKFAIPFARRGIVWDGAASHFLPRLVGVAKASEWGVTGRMIKADEALAAGLVSELTAPEEVLPRAMEIAQDIAQNCSPESTAQIKRLLRLGMEGSSPFQAHIEESVELTKAFASADCMEGVQSFLQKRPPNFKDRS